MFLFFIILTMRQRHLQYLIPGNIQIGNGFGGVAGHTGDDIIGARTSGLLRRGRQSREKNLAGSEAAGNIIYADTGNGRIFSIVGGGKINSIANISFVVVGRADACA